MSDQSKGGSVALDSTVINKLEAAVAAGDFVIMPKAELETLRYKIGAPPSTVTTFSEADIRVLVELIRIWRGISALGVLARFAKSALYALGALIAFVLFIKGKVS